MKKKPVNFFKHYIGHIAHEYEEPVPINNTFAQNLDHTVTLIKKKNVLTGRRTTEKLTWAFKSSTWAEMILKTENLINWWKRVGKRDRG